MKGTGTIKGLPELAGVQREMEKTLHQVPCGSGEMIAFLLRRSGKMLRPQLLLASAALSGEGRQLRGALLLKTAAAVELIHIASLVHDDIIDEAGVRRGEEALHLRWGNRRAALAGDFLLARAFDLLSRPGCNKNVLILLARTVSQLCLGEICQLNYQYRWELIEKQYYRVIDLKTAWFIAACCEAGGWISGAAPVHRRALRRFGLKLGQAFQIADDILDYTGSQEQLGKPAGNDIKQGRPTLPLIHLFATQRKYLEILRVLPVNVNSTVPAEIRRKLRQAVIENGSLDYASAAACKKRAEALESLQCFPLSPQRQLLEKIAMALTIPLCRKSKGSY